jgi:flagellar hook-associated protein 3 FlgL
MMVGRSVDSMQAALSRLAKVQEQLSTGRIINRPSDSPTGTTAAMRLRSSISDQTQYVRNAEDGLGWMGQIDTSLSSIRDQVRRAKDLALQGASDGSMSDAGRQALAAEVDEIRKSAVAGANATYLGRPVFGGSASGSVAYTEGIDPVTGGFTATFAGTTDPVTRTVGAGIDIQVNVSGANAFGPIAPGGPTAPGQPDVFTVLANLSASLRTPGGDSAGIQTSLGQIDAAMNKMTTAQTTLGASTVRVESAIQTAKDTTLNMQTQLSSTENVDLPKATMDLQMQQVAYQAALAATAKVLQPSLMDFMR